MDEILLSLNRYPLKKLTKFTAHNNAMRLRFIIIIVLCLIFKISAQTHINLY